MRRFAWRLAILIDGFVIVLLSVAGLTALASYAGAQPFDGKVPAQVLVQFRLGVSEAQAQAVIEVNQGWSLRQILQIPVHVVALPEAGNVSGLFGGNLGCHRTPPTTPPAKLPSSCSSAGTAVFARSEVGKVPEAFAAVRLRRPQRPLHYLTVGGVRRKPLSGNTRGSWWLQSFASSIRGFRL